MTKYSPISVDNMWDELSDEDKFKVWNYVSCRLFYSQIVPVEIRNDLREELSDLVDEIVRRSST